MLSAAKHATLHCGVVAFDLDAVKRSRVTANQHTTGEGHFRQRVLSALCQCTRTVGNAFATLQHFAGLGVGFPTLELFKRAQMWVAVIQIGNQPQVNLVVSA